MKFSPLALILLAALLVPADQAFAAKTGTLSVNVAGVPKKSKKAQRSITVRAIDVRTGALVQASSATRTNVSLKLQPGAYVVAVRSIDFPGKAVEGVSGIAVVKAGKKTKKKLRAKSLKKSKKKSKKASISADIPASYFAPASETADKIIAGVDPAIKIRGFDEYPDGLSIDSVLMTPLTKGCPADTPKLRFVEIARRDELRQEVDRADDPRFDQKTTVKKGRWWKERQMVRGSGIAENGRLTVQLTFVDLATGEVLSSSIAEGAEKDFLDVIEEAANSLLKKICGGDKVDVTFTGSGSYKRDEGSGDMTSEDHVVGNYNWSITYRGISLDAPEAQMNFASTSQISGSWSVDGRFGAVGPGSYQCSSPLKGYNGEFAVTKAQRFGGNARLIIQPYLMAMGDINAISCTGLSSPPFASFATWGNAPAHMATVDFAVADVSAGPLTFNVGPTATLAPDCSDVIGSYESPCSHSSTWSGTVTVSRAQP